MATAPTRLAFDARIGGVGIKQGRDSHGRGKFEVSLTVDQPEPPNAPLPPWEFRLGTAWKPRPGNAQKAKGESEEDFQRRKATTETEQLRYDGARAAFGPAEADYQERLRAYRQRIRSYAELVGITSVFGNKSVSVIITPLDQDLIPGFGTELAAELPPPAPFDPDDFEPIEDDDAPEE